MISRIVDGMEGVSTERKKTSCLRKADDKVTLAGETTIIQKNISTLEDGWK